MTAVGRTTLEPQLGPVDPSRPDGPVAVQVPRQLHEVSSGPDGMPRLLVRAFHGRVSGVVVVDMQAYDQPMLYVNPVFEQLTGYTCAEVVGRNCRLLQTEGTDPEAVRALAQAIRRGQEHQCVILNHRKDGAVWWNELHLSPVKDQTGKVTHYLGYQHDLSARVEAEQALTRQASRDSLTGLGQQQPPARPGASRPGCCRRRRAGSCGVVHRP